VGPTIADGAIVFADLASSATLPAGWTLETAPGRARLERLPDGPGQARTFQYTVSGEGIKRFTFPSRVDALSMDTAEDGTVRVLVRRRRAVALAIVGAEPATSPRSRCTTGPYRRSGDRSRLRGPAARPGHRRRRVRARLEHASAPR
jgi:hypothetical protein